MSTPLQYLKNVMQTYNNHNVTKFSQEEIKSQLIQIASYILLKAAMSKMNHSFVFWLLPQMKVSSPSNI